MPTVGLGWLRGTVRAEPQVVMDALRPFFGQTETRPFGVRWYASAATLLDRRVTIGWDGIGGAAGTTLVDVTQQALDHLGWEGSLDLAATLRDLGLKPSRIDLYVDDRSALADPLDVHAALENGQVVTHAQGYELRTNSAGGATTYVGARSSDRYLRAYRTGPTHGYTGTRWEMETKGLAAADVLAALAAPGDAATALVRQIVSFVDFRDRAGIQHGNRAPRLAWWAALVGSLERVRGTVRQRIDTLARRALWVRSQVAPSLAVLAAAPGYGQVWLAEMLHDGRRRAGGTAWASG